MHIFVITSILKPRIGLLDPVTRYSQTLKTIQSIKDKAPGAMIILIDSSPDELGQTIIDDLKSKVDYLVPLNKHKQSVELANKGLKSPGECYIMVIALDIIKNLGLPKVDRIFKITGRAELNDNFHIEDYNNPDMKGKFVFKTPVVSWMSPQIKLVDTRLWSFEFNMLEEVDMLIRNAYNECMTTSFDLEHSYYKFLDKEKIFEKDVIGLSCQLASDGVMINE